jgi:two-component system, cell cycle sensor histidine kinase and response regulator CckA
MRSWRTSIWLPAIVGVLAIVLASLGGNIWIISAVGLLAVVFVALWPRTPVKPDTDLERLRLLESAVVHARDAVVILSDQQAKNAGRSVLYVNKAFTDITGYAAAEVIGRSLHFLRGPKSDPNTLAKLRDALNAKNPYQCEILNYRKDGTTFWGELSVVPVPGSSEAVAYWVMIQRDVSDRKTGEEKLRHSETMLAEAQQLANIGSWEFVPGQAACWWSSEMYRIYAVDPKQGQPSTATLLANVHPEDRDRVLKFHQLLQQKREKEPKAVEFRIVRPDGSIRYVVTTYSQELEPNTLAISRLTGTTQDVTERRLSQAQLLQAQKMELIGRMAGGIAHDFNNMLTGLIGHLELLQLAPGEANFKRMETIHSAALRATKISKNLLGLARKSDLHRRCIDLAPIVQEVVDFLQNTSNGTIRFDIDIRTRSCVQGDRTFLHQVLLNLCVNARDAMPNGGTMTIRVEESRFPAGLTNSRTGEYIRLTVADSGTGIPTELREKIFEPFFTTKSSDKGTGLGLAMVHSIVEQHHGWIELESNLGFGTQFHVQLPLFDRCGDEEESASKDETVVDVSTPVIEIARRPLVLVIDDEPMIRDLACAILETEGYEVHTAQDGYDAVKQFRTTHVSVQLVILDLTMPGLSGKETYRELRTISPTANVLLSSGYTSENLQDIDGVLGLLPKPYRPVELLAAVRQAVAGKKLDQESELSAASAG